MNFTVPDGEPQAPRRLASWLDPKAVEARGERHLAMLAKLADMGLAAAIVCGRIAQEVAPEKSVRHHDAFVRAGRFATLAVAHEAHIAAGLREQARREASQDRGAPRRLPAPGERPGPGPPLDPPARPWFPEPTARERASGTPP